MYVDLLFILPILLVLSNPPRSTLLLVSFLLIGSCLVVAIDSLFFSKDMAAWTRLLETMVQLISKDCTDYPDF